MAESNKPQQASLLDLPPELLAKVVSYLAVPYSTSSVQAVLKTCRQLYQIALPVSVSTFRNTVHYSQGGGPCSPTRNAQFLHYILISKPWLARHVHTVILGSFSSTTNLSDTAIIDEARRQNGISADDELSAYRHQMKTILDQISSDDNNYWCDHWTSDLKSGCSDAQISLILLACPNIRTLLFEESKRPRHFLRLLGLLGHLSLANASDPGWAKNPAMPLANVQDVFQESNDMENGYSRWYEQVPVLLTLPRLRSYECNMPHGDERAAEQFGYLPSGSSLVEEITLRSAFIIPSTFSNMVKACKALRKLEYVSYTNVPRPEVLAPQDLMEALLPQAESLTELYINVEEDWDKGWGYRPHDALYMGTGLRLMVALSKLTLGMQCLTGMLADKPENNENTNMPLKVEGAPRIIDCLPENLEYLKIHSCSGAISEQVAELLLTVEEGRRFTKLAYIGLLFNSWVPEQPDFPLRCNAPNVHLDIGYQSKVAYRRNLGHPNTGEKETGRGPRHITSRIHSAKHRERYLANRGLSEAF